MEPIEIAKTWITGHHLLSVELAPYIRNPQPGKLDNVLSISLCQYADGLEAKIKTDYYFSPKELASKLRDLANQLDKYADRK